MFRSNSEFANRNLSMVKHHLRSCYAPKFNQQSNIKQISHPFIAITWFCRVFHTHFSYKHPINTSTSQHHMSHEKNPPTFHYTGWLIGILITAYCNPYIPPTEAFILWLISPLPTKNSIQQTILTSSERWFNCSRRCCNGSFPSPSNNAGSAAPNIQASPATCCWQVWET